jgi:hypothetical protein
METGILAAETIAEGRDTLLTDAQVRARYEAALLAMKPRFDLYERANAVNEHPWLADLGDLARASQPAHPAPHERGARGKGQSRQSWCRCAAWCGSSFRSPDPRPAMCQLLGMNANAPTDVCFSFAGLATRADEHKDGFGIAFFEDRGPALLRRPPQRSSFAGGRTGQALPDQERQRHRAHPQGHPGRVALENTHPFVRELWGRYWVFAHNGDLKDLPAAPARRLPARSATPTASAPSAG